jgi:hypothetical protein
MELNRLPSIEMELLKYNGQLDYWEDYGTITTDDPEKMQALLAWFRSGAVHTEDELGI